jgi:hypothetical protein
MHFRSTFLAALLLVAGWITDGGTLVRFSKLSVRALA